MDEETREFLTQQFGQIAQQFADLRRELDERFARVDERFAETRRHFDVVAEALRGDIRLIAEGHVMLRDQIQAAVEALQRENEAQHRETRAMVKLSFAELDRRLTRLETLTVDLESRLSRLEQER